LTKLPYARDRLVEAYFWVLGVFYEPQYALGRAIFTKIHQITSILDDTYDAYGLFDELALFTEAVQRFVKHVILGFHDLISLHCAIFCVC